MKDHNRKEIFSNIYNRISIVCSKNSGVINLLNNQSILDFTSFVLGYKNHNEYKQANKKTKNQLIYNQVDISTYLEKFKIKNPIAISSLDSYQISCPKNKNKEQHHIDTKEIVLPSIIKLGYDLKGIMKSYERLFINAKQVKILTDNIEHKAIKEIIDEIKNTNTKTVELEKNEEFQRVDFLAFLYNKNLLEDFFYDENDLFSHIFLHIVDQNHIQKDEHPTIDDLIEICRLEHLLSCLFSSKSTNLLKNIIKKYLVKNIDINVIVDNSNTISLNEATIDKHEKNMKLILSKLVAIKNIYDSGTFKNNGFFIENSQLKNTQIYSSQSNEIEEEIFSYLFNKTLENKTFGNAYLINKSNIQLNSVNKHHIDISNKVSDYEDYSDIIILDKKFNYFHNQFLVDFHINTKNLTPIFSNDYKWIDGTYFYMKKVPDDLNIKYEMKTIYTEKPQK